MKQKDAIPGYEILDGEILSDPATSAWSTEEWRLDFERSLLQITTFLRVREPLAVLAKSAMRHMIESQDRSSREVSDTLPPIEQGEIEVLQALLLAQTVQSRNTATSPSNFVRLWTALSRHVIAFVRKDPATHGGIKSLIARRARLQTVHYRNLFTQEDCERTVLALLARVDDVSGKDLGYRISDLYRALLTVLAIVMERLEVFRQRLHQLLTTTDLGVAHEAIAFFAEATPITKDLWARYGRRFTTLEDVRGAGFQLSEMANRWIYEIPDAVLRERITADLLPIVRQLSLRRGDLAEMPVEHIYLNNPVWAHPFVALDNGNLFVPLPQLVLSFPFAIIESLIEGHARVQRSYERSRAETLQSELVALISRALPSADVHEHVVWTDPDSGKTYENDVVALIGNTIFIFEAKGGRLAPAARRGGAKSLERNFRELFVEPGEQAWRLSSYLERHGATAVVRSMHKGRRIDLRLERKKTIHSYSVCIEHFASLTSAKYYLKQLGLVTNETAWAPVLSLGELQILERFLDTEISFFHYLARRATIEKVFDFEGDEQDLLAMYLTNGFCIDDKLLVGQRVMFHNADAPVRKPKQPRGRRKSPEVLGVPLSPLWREVVRELYLTEGLPHRFDLIQCVLNQLPNALRLLEQRIRRWRHGEPIAPSVMVARREIGGTRYLVIGHFQRKAPTTLQEWRDGAMQAASAFAQGAAAVDCAVMLYVRKSKEITFDAISFFRLVANPHKPAEGSRPAPETS